MLSLTSPLKLHPAAKQLSIAINAALRVVGVCLVNVHIVEREMQLDDSHDTTELGPTSLAVDYAAMRRLSEGPIQCRNSSRTADIQELLHDALSTMAYELAWKITETPSKALSDIAAKANLLLDWIEDDKSDLTSQLAVTLAREIIGLANRQKNTKE